MKRRLITTYKGIDIYTEKGNLVRFTLDGLQFIVESLDYAQSFIDERERYTEEGDEE